MSDRPADVGRWPYDCSVGSGRENPSSNPATRYQRMAEINLVALAKCMKHREGILLLVRYGRNTRDEVQARAEVVVL